MTLERQVLHCPPGFWIHPDIHSYVPEDIDCDYTRRGEILLFEYASTYILGKVPASCSLDDQYSVLKKIYDDPESAWQARISHQINAGVQMTEDFLRHTKGYALPHTHDRRLRMAFCHPGSFLYL